MAVDTQLYVLSSLLFYLSHRLRISINYIGGFAIAAAVCLQGTTVMTTNFEGLLRYNPRSLPTEAHFLRPQYTVSYSGTVSNLTPYVTVFLIGILYAKKKNSDFLNTVASKFVWHIVFVCLPLISAQLYNYHFSRIIETLMAVTLRPLFSSGIAIGFLGMATNTGGRRIFST
ncbi:hypothetical protein WA026_013356 [Henosepilachna vigintioctopunctata]|uniref:Uncharacterized protein n=1 Tax=Henosepilachna vigintioctopunctata TaxID=420089 RepID=A0AAW1VCV6_9CUCU